MPSRVERPAATEVVVARIREAIERGELKAGDRLPPERELAAQLGVSRPSIRSGLQSLEGIGILEARQGAGTFIAAGPPALDPGPMAFLAALHGWSPYDLFEAREALEAALAGLAAVRATPDQVMAIGDETTAMYASLDEPQAFLAHDIAFHRAVGTGAGSPVLAALAEMVASMFYDARSVRERTAADLRVSAGEHRAIYQAIRARNAGQAREAMSAHLSRAKAAVRGVTS